MKADQQDLRQVQTYELHNLSSEIGVPCMELSGNVRRSVKTLFARAAYETEKNSAAMV